MEQAWRGAHFIIEILTNILFSISLNSKIKRYQHKAISVFVGIPDKNDDDGKTMMLKIFDCYSLHN